MLCGMSLANELPKMEVSSEVRMAVRGPLLGQVYLPPITETAAHVPIGAQPGGARFGFTYGATPVGGFMYGAVPVGGFIPGSSWNEASHRHPGRWEDMLLPSPSIPSAGGFIPGRDTSVSEVAWRNPAAVNPKSGSLSIVQRQDQYYCQSCFESRGNHSSFCPILKREGRAQNRAPRSKLRDQEMVPSCPAVLALVW